MASTLVRHAFATHRCAVSRSIATHVHIPSRHASTGVLLYGISALSNRHETQYFSKLSRLPLMEHSPTLKLIHTSEVQPGASSVLPLSSQSGISQENEHEELEQKESRVQRQTGEPSDEPGHKQIPNNGVSSVGRSALSYKSEIAHLHMVEGQLRTQIKRYEETSRSRATKSLVFMVYGLALLVFGKWVYESHLSATQEQIQALQELQSSLKLLVADLTTFAAQAEATKGISVEQHEERHTGDGLSVQKLNNLEPSASLTQPALSWGSLLWKKQ